MGKGKRAPPSPSIETEETLGTVETPRLGVTFGLEVPDGLPTEEQKRRTARSFQGKDIDDVALKFSEVLLDHRLTDLLDDKGGLGEAVTQESGKVIEYATDHPDEQQLPLGELHKPEGAFTLTITEVLGSCKFGAKLELPASLEARGLVLVVGTGFDPYDEFAPVVGELPSVPLTYIRFLPHSNHRFASTFAVRSCCVLPLEPATIEIWRHDLRYGPANLGPLLASADLLGRALNDTARQFMEELSSEDERFNYLSRLLLLTGLKRDFSDAEEALATKAATKAEAAALKVHLS